MEPLTRRNERVHIEFRRRRLRFERPSAWRTLATHHHPPNLLTLTFSKVFLHVTETNEHNIRADETMAALSQLDTQLFRNFPENGAEVKYFTLRTEEWRTGQQITPLR
jgi:hypothetical protein